MRILLTGATGFIGRHVAKALAEAHDLAILVRPGSQGPFEPRAQKRVWSDEPAEQAALLAAVAPDAIVHLASLFRGVHKPEEAGALIESNVRFPVQLLEAALAAGCKRFVNTGTAWQHFENAPYAPVNLYAASKQAFADVLAAYVELSGFSSVTLELTDTYGPDDTRPKLLALLQKASLSGEVLALSAGEQFVDFVHVSDVVAAFCLALERVLALPDGQGELYAVRSREPMRLRDFLALYNELAASPVRTEWGARPYRPRETMVPCAYGPLLPAWEPRISLREGLRELLEQRTSL